MSVVCSSSQATLTIGNGSQHEYIYKTCYVWSNNQWMPFNYSGNLDSTGNWVIGKATASTSLSGSATGTKYSVLAYICEWTGVWNCGCHDSNMRTQLLESAAVQIDNKIVSKNTLIFLWICALASSVFFAPAHFASPGAISMGGGVEDTLIDGNRFSGN